MFTVDTVAEPTVRPLPSKEAFRLHLIWPKDGEQHDLNKVFFTAFKTALTVLQDASFLPDGK